MGQTKCRPWSWGLGEGLKPNLRKIYCCEISRPYGGGHGGGQDAHRIVAPVKKKKEILENN
jgi:hypothetical protein